MTSSSRAVRCIFSARLAQRVSMSANSCGIGAASAFTSLKMSWNVAVAQLKAKRGNNEHEIQKQGEEERLGCLRSELLGDGDAGKQRDGVQTPADAEYDGGRDIAMLRDVGKREPYEKHDEIHAHAREQRLKGDARKRDAHDDVGR